MAGSIHIHARVLFAPSQVFHRAEVVHKWNDSGKTWGSLPCDSKIVSSREIACTWLEIFEWSGCYREKGAGGYVSQLIY